MEYKACPLLVQSDTTPSFTLKDAVYTRTYFLECLANKCAAYQIGMCQRFNTTVIYPQTNITERED